MFWGLTFLVTRYRLLSRDHSATAAFTTGLHIVVCISSWRNGRAAEIACRRLILKPSAVEAIPLASRYYSGPIHRVADFPILVSFHLQ